MRIASTGFAAALAAAVLTAAALQGAAWVQAVVASIMLVGFVVGAVAVISALGSVADRITR